MLKIVGDDRGRETGLLRLEGRLVGPWVEELRRTCGAARASAGRVTLDLQHLSFVDLEGLKLLEDLAEQDAVLVNCSAFVTEQLKAWRRR